MASTTTAALARTKTGAANAIRRVAAPFRSPLSKVGRGVATAGAKVGEALRGDAKRLLAQRGKDAGATFAVAAARESAAGAKVAAKLGVELDVVAAALSGALLFFAPSKRLRRTAQHLFVGSIHAVAARMGTALPAKIEAATSAVGSPQMAGVDSVGDVGDVGDVEEPGEAA